MVHQPVVVVEVVVEVVHMSEEDKVAVDSRIEPEEEDSHIEDEADSRMDRGLA